VAVSCFWDKPEISLHKPACKGVHLPPFAHLAVFGLHLQLECHVERLLHTIPAGAMTETTWTRWIDRRRCHACCPPWARSAYSIAFIFQGCSPRVSSSWYAFEDVCDVLKYSCNCNANKVSQTTQPPQSPGPMQHESGTALVCCDK